MAARRLIAVLLTTLVAALLPAPGAAARWHPQPTTAWQWQLQGKIDTSIEAGVYEVDGFEVAACDP